MDEMMENIQKVLNDPESMKQISQLAQMLGLDNQQPSQPAPEKPVNPPQSDFSDFSKLFSSAPRNPPPKSDNTSDFDFSKLMELSKVFEHASKPDKNTQLILALKPHLKAETQEKADRLVKIFKLMYMLPLLKDSGLLGGDFSGIL